MVLAEPGDRPPEVLFRFGAENLGRLALGCDLGLTEMQPSAPAAVLQTTDGDADRDRLAVDPDRVELMHYGLPRVAGSGSEVRHAHDDTSGGGSAKIRAAGNEAMLFL